MNNYQEHQVLISFWNTHKTQAKHFNWLQGRTYSEAFVICLGAGPWKFERRKKIQGEALVKLNKRDISCLSDSQVQKMFPLKWQVKFLSAAIKNLPIGTSFNSWCANLVKNPNSARYQLLTLTKASNNAKVISLFCRDALKIPSFPIDRHVKRKLIELNLPTDEDAMITLCQSCKLNPRDVAVLFVREASDMDNPNWRVE